MDRATATPCWSCKGPVPAGQAFCPTCDAVQPPGQVDHFARLGIEAGYDLAAADLDRRYFALQRRLHPDRFATRTPKERALSQQQATSLNDAYETLKDPLKRADYLVHLRGSGVLPEGCDMINDPVVLMEAMELRERLSESESPSEVDAIYEQTAGDIRECIEELKRVFAAGELKAACRLTTRLKYLTKLSAEVKARRTLLAHHART